MSNKDYLCVVKGISREALVKMAYKAGEQDATKHIRAVWKEKMMSLSTDARNAICGKSSGWAAIQRDVKQIDGEGYDNRTRI